MVLLSLVPSPGLHAAVLLLLCCTGLLLARQRGHPLRISSGARTTKKTTTKATAVHTCEAMVYVAIMDYHANTNGPNHHKARAQQRRRRRLRLCAPARRWWCHPSCWCPRCPRPTRRQRPHLIRTFRGCYSADTPSLSIPIETPTKARPRSDQ